MAQQQADYISSLVQEIQTLIAWRRFEIWQNRMSHFFPSRGFATQRELEAKLDRLWQIVMSIEPTSRVSELNRRRNRLYGVARSLAHQAEQLKKYV